VADEVTSWPIGTDCKVVISGVKDDTGAIIVDAVVTGVLKQTDTGAAVNNASALTFTAVGDASYWVLIPNNADLLDGRSYTLEVTALKSGRKLFAKITKDAAFVTM
jgi:hypothetical protein